MLVINPWFSGAAMCIHALVVQLSAGHYIRALVVHPCFSGAAMCIRALVVQLCAGH